MNKLSKKAKERREKSLQFTGGKRNGNSSWSEDLLNLHMNNDRCLYDYVKKNKKSLLKMKKDTKIAALKRNGCFIKGDSSKIKNRYVRRSYLDKCIRDV